MSQYKRFKILSLTCWRTVQCSIKDYKVYFMLAGPDKKFTEHFSPPTSHRWLQNIICGDSGQWMGK